MDVVGADGEDGEDVPKTLTLTELEETVTVMAGEER